MNKSKHYSWLLSGMLLLLACLMVACDSQYSTEDNKSSQRQVISDIGASAVKGNSALGTVVYQIYPRSFKDSNGDGIGDLQGIVNELDYLQELGVNAIWFSPFFKSPQADLGYDVSDYYDISPEYGTMEDFDKLLKEMHARNMKMILDLPLNHTSAEHPWFKESESSKDNPRRDWYIWRDGRKPGGKAPPNNWKSMTGGPAWLYYKNTDQWVYFEFLPFLPDLNYRNPDVKEAMFNVMRFWLDKGVDGFRLDLLYAIYEDEQLRDDSFSWTALPSDKTTARLFTAHKYDLNLPETFDITLELREIANEYQPERLLIGEAFGTVEELRKYYGPENNGLHMVFLFEFTSTPFKPDAFAKIIDRIEKVLPPPYIPTYVFSNHDRVRFISRLGNDIAKAKIAATMQLTLRGVPIIYYGEEIGMPNSDVNLKTSQDPIGRRYAWAPSWLTKVLGLSLSRDGCRTPMQWSDEPTAGFSVNHNAKTWLKVSDSYKEINVAEEEKDPYSLLNCYKRLLRVRKENVALQDGAFEFIKLENLEGKCLAYRRVDREQELFIYLNFSEDTLELECPVERPVLLLSTLSSREALDLASTDQSFILGPLEGVIFKSQ